MRITLQIENVDRLETGGQVSYACADRGFDIGRHEHLDWSLPDPQRVVSGKHCEVRFEGGQFVLYDVSTNGTFLNGSPNRMDTAHVLRSGDRLMIGDYIIAVTLDSEESAGAGFAQPSHAASDAGYPPQSPGWQTPQGAAAAAPEPQWPAAQSPAQAPYPAQDANAPWGPPAVGMEGRHAPPSQAPGIGTPADDVWSKQSHGWGGADPELYDPQAQVPDREPVRPAQADPMDHLAMQPDLHPQDAPAQAPAAPRAAPAEAPPFPAPRQDQAASEPSAPLFKMPDLAAEQEQAVQSGEAPQASVAPEPSPVKEPVDTVQAAPDVSPFPETPAQQEVPPEPAPAGSEGTEPESQASAEKAPPPTDPVAAAESKPQVAEPSEAAAPARAVANIDFLKAFAEGAGISEKILAERDPEEFAREMGEILQGITGDLMGLLQARSQVKAMTRNANRTLIGRSGNNALKFSPTPQMALQTMLAANVEETGYLPLPKAMTEAFKDIQKHHVWTYAAMQKAAARFDETLSPNAIETDGHIAKSTFGNQKAKLWERMQERWTSLSGAYDDGLVGVFTQYFTECYEELSSEEPEQ